MTKLGLLAAILVPFALLTPAVVHGAPKTKASKSVKKPSKKATKKEEPPAPRVEEARQEAPPTELPLIDEDEREDRGGKIY